MMDVCPNDGTNWTCEHVRPADDVAPRPPNIDYLIHQRYIEMGFSDEMIAELEAFTKAEAERIKAARNDGPQPWRGVCEATGAAIPLCGCPEHSDGTGVENDS